MKWLLLSVLALCGAAHAGVAITAPASLDSGQTGTVTVTVTNDNKPTEARDLTLAATLYWTEGGVNKKAVADPVTVHVAAGEGFPYIRPLFQFPIVAGLEYDWKGVTFSGDAVGPYMDSARVCAAESLAPGKSWSVTVPVKAP